MPSAPSPHLLGRPWSGIRGRWVVLWVGVGGLGGWGAVGGDTDKTCLYFVWIQSCFKENVGYSITSGSFLYLFIYAELHYSKCGSVTKRCFGFFKIETSSYSFEQNSSTLRAVWSSKCDYKTPGEKLWLFNISCMVPLHLLPLHYARPSGLFAVVERLLKSANVKN